MPRSSSAPPPEFRSEQPEVRVLGEPLPVVGGHGDDVAERAARPATADTCDVRQEPRPHGLHREQLALPGHGDDLARLGGVHRERLLDQHRLARPQGEHRVVAMHRVRRGDVDDVDVRDRRPATRSRTVPVARCRKRRRTGQPTPGCASRQRRPSRSRSAAGPRERAGDTACSEDPPPHRLVVHRLVLSQRMEV